MFAILIQTTKLYMMYKFLTFIVILDVNRFASNKKAKQLGLTGRHTFLTVLSEFLPAYGRGSKNKPYLIPYYLVKLG